jgi:thiamine-monophosphate kinase
MASEKELIERAGKKLPSRSGAGLRVGVGDDAAVMRPKRGVEWVITTDAFLEYVHFLMRAHPPEAVGYKALARATSDLAAMGARPLYFLLSVALPASCTGKWFDSFLEGMARAARGFGLVLAGGDTTKSDLAAINLTIVGEVQSGQTVLRSGARPGNLICVSGRLGEAELGLQLLLRNSHKTRKWKPLLQKHLYPQPRLDLGRWLAKPGRATAMIDMSDGLSTDLKHLCEASGVGARVLSTKIPKVAVPSHLQKIGLDPLRLALEGGEDYELLFTVPKLFAKHLPRLFRGVPITVIGEITREKRNLLIDETGRAAALSARGWDPFRK